MECAVLLADRIAWRYEGVLHEYVTADVPHRFVPLAGPWIDAYHEGARSRDPQTYLKDAAILEAALGQGARQHALRFLPRANPQGCRTAGARARAYRHRATMGGWDEEAWQARYQAAQLVERLGHSPADINEPIWKHSMRGRRVPNPWFSLRAGIVCVRSGRLALLFARAAAAIPRPADLLFVEDAVYAWKAEDELSVAAWHANARNEGRRAAERLIAARRFPLPSASGSKRTLPGTGRPRAGASFQSSRLAIMLSYRFDHAIDLGLGKPREAG